MRSESRPSELTAASPPAPGDRELPCPGCGYDLRALGAGRCPECGLEIDTQAMNVTAIPWAYRRTRGRARAYVRTTWQFIRGRKTLAHEASRPQDPADARAYVRTSGAILAVALVAAWGTLVMLTGGRVYQWIAYDPRYRFAVQGADHPLWLDDVMAPWSAGVVLPWVVPLGLVLLGFHLAGVQRTVFRARGSAEVRRAAVAIGAYAAAPMMFLVPALGGGAWVAWRLWVPQDEAFRPWHEMGVTGCAVAIAGAACLLAAVVGTPIGVVRWVARTTHGGAIRVALAPVELLALWVLGAGLFLFALPWAAGFVWIVVDSFR